MIVLGISYLETASACILKDGEVIAAISEERLNRVKMWNGIPVKSIQYLFEMTGITIDDVDVVATHGAAPETPDEGPYYDKIDQIKRAKIADKQTADQIDRILARLEHDKDVFKNRTPKYLQEIKEICGEKGLKVYPHHKTHAACAYFGSGWRDATVLTADGWGEDGAGTVYHCEDGQMTLVSSSQTFNSLGYFYGSITNALGFKPHRHEGKILGLAAYCKEPKSLEKISKMIDYDPEIKGFNGRMENRYVPHFENPYLDEIVNEYSREDICGSAQITLEKTIMAWLDDLEGENLKIGLAGGVFANVVVNQRILDHEKVAEIFVYPHMGDGGLCVGAAYQAYFDQTGESPSPCESALLGPSFTENEIESELIRYGLKYSREDDITEVISDLLSKGNVIARFHGRMEFGPRALGSRSILYQCSEPEVNNWLNKKLKRSEFMPFAPVTLLEDCSEYYLGFEGGEKAASFMTTTFCCTQKMKEESPAAVHVDGTARPQLVTEVGNSDLYNIIKKYKAKTGLSSIINTSFNMHEEPIVCSPDDGIRAFLDSKIEYLAIENFIVKQ